MVGEQEGEEGWKEAPRTVLEKDGKARARKGQRGPREENSLECIKGFMVMLGGGGGKELEPDSQLRTPGWTSEAQTEPWRWGFWSGGLEEPYHSWKAGVLATGTQHRWASCQGQARATGRSSFPALED